MPTPTVLMTLPLVPPAVQTVPGAALKATALPEAPPVALQVLVLPTEIELGVQTNEVMVWEAKPTATGVVIDVAAA